MKNSALILKIIFSVLLASIVGFLSGPNLAVFGVPLVEFYGLIGDLFLNALSLVVVPLVVSSIILGAARMGSDDSIGSLGSKTLGYFVLNITLGVLVGYATVKLLAPGAVQSESLAFSSMAETALQNVENAAQNGPFLQFKLLLMKILPSNILAVAAQGQMLGLILFCLLFGYFMMKIETQASSVLLTFWKGIFEIMMKMTQFIMKALPIGVFGLVAKSIATVGVEAFQSIAWFFIVALIALAIYACIVLPLLLKCLAKVSPLAHVKAMSPALATAFSTSSSAAALPVVIDCVEKRAGISNRICGFTVPLGTAVNLAGSALYTCMVVFFIAQVYEVSLPFSTQILIVLMSILSSFGMAGIPSACLIAIVVILQAIGLSPEGLGLVLAVERLLDMFRTATNVFGNTCCAVLIAKSEGETQVLSDIEASQAIAL